MRKEKGNPDLSDEILCAEYEAVFRYALSLCRNETEAWDITQETFLKAMKATGSFEGGSSLYTWLCTIAKNIWFNKCKKLKREMPGEELKGDIPDSAKSMESCLVEKDMSMQIHQVLHALNEPYKEVFSLRVFGQLSFADIAVLFSKTESWARVTYYRARKMITESLRKEGVL